MCIIVVKNKGVKYPDNETLKQCFNSNKDGAGFMIADGSRVHINKGFFTFESFIKALAAARAKYGDNAACVLHFRISTQAGINAACCHPFALSSNIERLKKTSDTAKIGVAHNGVIDYCSDWSCKTHNDTMQFISDYLSKIIKGVNYYKNAFTIKLINALISGSRLAIMDCSGHIERLGNGWQEAGGVYYSNSSYKPINERYVSSWSGGQKYAYDWGELYDYNNEILTGAADGSGDIVATIERERYGDCIAFALYDYDGELLDYSDYYDLDAQPTSADIIADYNRNTKYKLQEISGGAVLI